jgi:WD40 repeat protein
MHYHKLQLNPLDVYQLFAFTPKSTIFQEIYVKSQSFPHPIVTMGLEDHWPQHESIRTHWIVTTHLSSCGNWLATGGYDFGRPVYGLWDLESVDGGTDIHPCGTFPCSVINVILYPHNSRLCLQTSCRCGLMCRWDPVTRPHGLIEEFRLDSNQRYVQWSEDGRYMVTEEQNDIWRECYLSSRDTPRDHARLSSEAGWKGTFSPWKGSKLAFYRGGVLRIWDCATMKRLFSKYPGKEVKNISFTPDAKKFFLCTDDFLQFCLSKDGTIIWNRQFGAEISFSTFFFNGQKIALRDIHNSVLIINAADGSTLNGPYNGPYANYTFIHPQNEQKALLINNGIISKWNPLYRESVQELYVIPDDIRYEGCMHLSWCHQSIVQVTRSTVTFYSTHSPAQQVSIIAALLSPDGNYLAALTKDGDIRIWDSRSGCQLLSQNISIHDISDLRIEFAGHSHLLLVWSPTTLEVMDIEMASIMRLDARKIVSTVFLHPPLQLACILTIETNGGVHLYPEEASKKPISPLSFRPSRSITFTISPDNSLLATTRDGILIIKDLLKGGLEMHWPGAFTGITFSPDSSQITIVEDHSTTSHMKLSDMHTEGITMKSFCGCSVSITHKNILRISGARPDDIKYHRTDHILDTCTGNTNTPMEYCKNLPRYYNIDLLESYLKNLQLSRNLALGKFYDGRWLVLDVSLSIEAMYVTPLFFFPSYIL